MCFGKKKILSIKLYFGPRERVDPRPPSVVNTPPDNNDIISVEISGLAFPYCSDNITESGHSP